MRRWQIGLAVSCLAAALCGCATGVVRTRTLGKWHYAAVDWTESAPPALKVPAAIGGGVADAGIIVADTAIAPMAAIWVAGALAIYGPDPNYDQFPPGLTMPIFIPVWLVVGIALSPVTCWEFTYGLAEPTPTPLPGTSPAEAAPTPEPLPERVLRP